MEAIKLIIKIIRGTNQIGGCVTEIYTTNSRILIDLGQALDGADESNRGDALGIPGVTKDAPNCDGLLFTHYHQDHVGLAHRALPGIPLFIGSAAKEISLRLYARTGNVDMLAQMKRAHTFRAGRQLNLGVFAITPILVDHSAFDSYMFLIEADGKKILHTGDFRLHGYKGKGVLAALEKYVGPVDMLICEGTTLSRDAVNPLPESELQKRAKEILRENKYVFVLSASTNIDRIAAFHAATPRGRYFLCDAFQKDVLEIARREAGARTSLYRFDKALVYGRNLDEKMRQQGFCMMVRRSPYFQAIMETFQADNPLVIYSMWEGYLRQDGNGFADFLEPYRQVHLHTSGHAGAEAIAQLCSVVKPKQGVIAIHSENPDGMRELAAPYTYIPTQDGQTIEV